MSIKKLDPLAQSFFIDQPLFLTKADLFFAEKDDNLPVFVQIRRNEDGFPSDSIVNFSTTFLPAANVAISSNANVATTVTFESPVFLDSGEYSLTLGSDSKNYKVYISQLDGTDITTEKRITEQPLLGSLFKSQNASEWVSSPFEDLKLRLYRASFTTNVTGTVDLSADNPPIFNILESDPLEVYPSSQILKVFHFNHAFVENSYVALRNVANANVNGNVGILFGLNGNVIQDVYYPISNVKFDSYNIILPSAVSNVAEPTRFGGSSVVVDNDLGFTSVTPQIATFRTSNTGINHKIITTTPSTGSSYTIDTEFTSIDNFVENKLDSSRVLVGLSNKLFKTANADSFKYRVELTTGSTRLSPIIDMQQLGVSFKRNLVNNPSYDDVLPHEIVTVVNNGKANVYPLSNTVALIYLDDTTDRDNANLILNGTILEITANVNDGQYRVVDILDGGANIKVAKLSGNVVLENLGNTASSNTYVITNSSAFIAEEAAEGGSAYSKYITRQVDLINPSTSIKFFVDVAKPINANLKFYFKSKLASDSTNLRDVEYTEITGVTIPNSLGGEFVEITKQLDNIPSFNSLVLKIVFLSSSDDEIPRIKNLRIIALE